MPQPTRLPPGQQLAAPGKWPVVGERQPANLDSWHGLRITGLVARPCQWSWAELAELPQVQRTVDIHCVTRWSKLDVAFRGVLLADLLRIAGPLGEARFVSFVAHSQRGHSTSLVLAEALELGALVAWDAAGQPLPVEAGGPLRVIVPGRYFYKSLKWLKQIELLAEDRLGYWEAVAGYHNEADPWREQRFVAAGISRQELARRLADLDFSRADMLGLELRGRDLTGMRAADALLRNADFRGSCLVGSSFERANLSNARMQRADLTGASFRDADLEGADLRAADLRGADLRGASLLGALFCTPDEAAGSESERLPEARLDAATQIDPTALEALAPAQAACVRRQLAG